MKVTDLMLNDWAKARLIGKEKWHILQIHALGEGICLEYEPIPLTEEILKVNFKQGAMDGFFYTNNVEIYSNDTNINIVAHFEENHIDYYCQYVHIFQHILRLIGLEELANNLKIE